jgi:hypothetical protein
MHAIAMEFEWPQDPLDLGLYHIFGEERKEEQATLK